jgi:nickel transport protein
MRKARIVISVLLLISVLSGHRVNIFTQVERDSVIGQCYYNDGTPVRKQKVEIFSSSGGKLLELETDSSGYFGFAPPVKADLRIVLHAGMGHQSETTIKASDLPDVNKISVEKPKVSNKAIVAEDEKPRFDEESLREIIEEVVEEKYNALEELIVKQQKSTSVITIIGGIGYIVGIFGLLLFLRYRKRE